jgi:hypothetical protein
MLLAIGVRSYDIDRVQYVAVRTSSTISSLLSSSSVLTLFVAIGFGFCKYCPKRGTWDETLDAFINVDGDPAQFLSYVIFLCSSSSLIADYYVLRSRFLLLPGL